MQMQSAVSMAASQQAYVHFSFAKVDRSFSLASPYMHALDRQQWNAASCCLRRTTRRRTRVGAGWSPVHLLRLLPGKPPPARAGTGLWRCVRCLCMAPGVSNGKSRGSGVLALRLMHCPVKNPQDTHTGTRVVRRRGTRRFGRAGRQYTAAS